MTDTKPMTAADAQDALTARAEQAERMLWSVVDAFDDPACGTVDFETVISHARAFLRNTPIGGIGEDRR